MKENITVPAVERALDVLEYLSVADEAKTLKEMAEDLGIPAASLFRIMKNLAFRGYVLQSEKQPVQYSLGYKFSQLAARLADKASIGSLVRPDMEWLSRESGQTTQFAVRRGNDVIYIEQVLSQAPVNLIAHLYTPMAPNTSAGAKCILSQMTVENQEMILGDCILEKNTKYTITDRKEFLRELTLTRERGYGTDKEEFSLGVGCIAVPVTGKDGECAGAVGITGRIDEYRDEDRFLFLRSLVEEAGKRIGRKL
ncbi:MAG: IclR family transcriptional regulator [Coprococcus sp.]|nr:IclR family transcriptional regulator [Coprococcus sp.]